MALSSVAALSTSVKTISAQEGSTPSLVKQERPDDEEINALAAKMVEANKAKMAATAANATRPGQPGQPHMVLPNQPGIISFFSRTAGSNASATAASAQPTSAKPTGPGEKAPCDSDSLKMRFGWVTLGKNHIPYITRFGEKYCAVRMVEMKLLSKYLTYLHSDIYNCTCVRSYYITEPEARLLNEINIKHCDSQFGREAFTTKDLVVRLQDADEFYTFLDVCYNKLMPSSNKPSTLSKCGFIRIDGESVVPYILRNGVKYVPVFYFEGEISSLFQKAELLEGWDLAYLKFCCKVQGIRAELFEKDDCSVISLEDIKGYFPAETEFHDYWPSKLVDKQLLVSTNKSEMAVASWTISPSSCAVPTPPPSKAPQPPAPAPQSVPPPRPPMPPVYSGMTMNGWNGVFHHAHNQQVNRMPRSVMHNGAMLMNMASGTSHPTQQPPPLVRVTTTPSTMSLSSPLYTTSNAIQQRMMTSQHQMLPPPQPQPQHPQAQHSLPHYHTSTANAKFPPPLVSVNGTTAQPQAPPQAQPRFPYLTTNGTDIIDLSSPPHSPQMMQMAGAKAVAGAAAAAAAAAAQRAKRQLPVGNGKVDSQPKIKQIPEAVHKGPHIPYKAQKALVEGRMVPCINMKPYVYSELLMTLPDLVAHFFPALHVSEVQTTLQEVLNLDLFQGNRNQMLVLKEEGKCSSSSDFLPLVQLTDVMKYMPQMRYMFSRRGAEEPPGKMKRPS